MAINLRPAPHKVSRDLSGYITYIYGAPKTGKTTLAVQMDKALLLAFEKGYNALPGVLPVDITSWKDMRETYRELKKPEYKNDYNAIVVDTIDIAADMCQKYICSQKGIESLGDLGYGKGWTAFKDEFNEIFRGLTQLGFAVFFIGHSKEVSVPDDTGAERLVVRPALSNSVMNVISGMADIYGYAHQKKGHEMSVLTLRSNDDSISCGGRFKYIADEIDMNYQNLVTAIQVAIDKEAAETGGKYVTNEKVDTSVPQHEYDYEGLMKEFQTMAGELMNKDSAYYGPRITKIIESYLGKGKKIADATLDQVEFIDLIVGEIKEDLYSKI